MIEPPDNDIRHDPSVPPDGPVLGDRALAIRVAELTRQRDQLAGQVRLQAAELASHRATLDSNRRQLLVTEVARLALWEWDIPSGEVFLGSRWGEMIGGSAEDDRWQMSRLFERVHPDDVAAARQALNDALTGKADRYWVEHRVSTVDGWIWIESVGMVTERDAGGRALRLTGVNSDITQRRRMHADIVQARADAEASSQAKSEFLANMSHEVRTPLNAVMGLTRLLYQSPLNDEQRSHLELIDSSATSLLALLNDILDLSKIEAGKLVFEQIRFNIGKWVRDAVAIHRPAAEKKGLQVELDLAADVPAKVAGDPGRLRQVISNLMSNAVKFTERGRIAVSVRLAPQQGDLGRDRLRLLFAVRDSGVGIPIDKQELIFEAFTQEDASTTRRYGGTGLGLAICARLVSMMDGAIHVTSRPREGSTFRFTAVFERVADEMSLLTEPAPLETVGTRGLHVLLAEDHAVNELLMRNLLAELGCTFSVARNGQEAVEQWKNGHYDLVLMDVQMPVLSGFDATAQIRAFEAARPERGYTPIVALTAHAMAGDREKCLAVGMDGYVSKPVSPPVLLQAMQEATAGHSAAGENMLELGPFESTQADGQPAVQVSQLMALMGGDLPAVQMLASAMCEDMAERLEAIRQAADQRDLRTMQMQAHSLKGAWATICAFPASDAARHLEGVLAAGDWNQIGHAVVLLEREAARVDVVLGRIIGEVGA